ncbi:hypothetical protein F4808DRAFT_158247 [Astrocystis sublimbata]|nr:hypothetical protein F4808DRAFT_158247 [Astrocystis sublimbata]
MDLAAASARLRRTFAYPSDTTTPESSRHHSADLDSDDDGPALDEQLQEELIQSLAQHNAQRNSEFRLILLSLPVLSTIPYFLILYGGVAGVVSRSRTPDGNRAAGVGRADIWLAFLALSSLAVTAWTLWSLPPGVTGIRYLDARGVGSSDGSNSNSNAGHGLSPLGANARRRRRASGATSDSASLFWAAGRHHSPLQQYLPLLNVSICGLLLFAGFLSSSSSSSSSPPSPSQGRDWGGVAQAGLPALIYVVVLVAKMLMGSIDPERDLGKLKYQLKGA